MTDPDPTDADVLGVLLASFPGTEVPDWVAAAVRGGLGGVVLFGENVPDPATARRLCADLHALGPELVVMIDEEGGDVSRLQAQQGSGLPGNAALGVVDDPELTRRCGVALGGLLHAVGVDVDLAPCLDVASEPWNPIIGTRSFGSDAELVARHARAVVVGVAEGGAGTCAKHYPGHGATTVDSHLGTPVLDVSADILRRRDLPPFTAAIGSGVDAVMTAHVVVPALGVGPASLEPWSSAWLRADGFTGPVVTDALGMAGAGGDLGLAAVAALRAGADLLCLDAPHERAAEPMFSEARDAIAAALTDGRLQRADLIRSRQRTRALGKRCARRREQPGPDLDAALAALEEVGAEAATRSLRITGAVGLSGPVQLIDLRPGQNLAAGATTDAFGRALEATGTPRWADADPDVVATPDQSDVLVLVREPHPDRPEGRRLAAVLAERPDAVVVHTGVPATAPTAARRILCHGTGRANAVAVMAAVTSGR